MPFLYLFAEPREWNAQSNNNVFTPESFHEEGFIHLCEREQVAPISARFFPDCKDLVLVTINEKKLTSRLERESFEDSLYPHLYGPLNKDAVTGFREYCSGETLS